MASYLLDTNLLLRLSDGNSPDNPTAAHSIATLLSSGHDVFITAQNLIEFWAVVTRPVEANGFGWSHERTIQEVEAIEAKFPLIHDSPQVLRTCLDLLKANRISGKRAHDARLAAVAISATMDHVLSFNTADFQKISEISVVDPRNVKQDRSLNPTSPSSSAPSEP